MEVALQECLICKRRNGIGLNYGVICCGACKMFFHRVLIKKEIPEPCQISMGCASSKCRSCRLKKCIQNGMLFTPTENLANPNNDDMLSILLFNLSCMDSHRNDKLYNYHLVGDPSLLELVRDMNSLRFEPRPLNIQMDPMEWGYISAVVAIEFMAKLPFVANLEVDDQIIIFRNCYFYLSLLSDSWRATQLKHDFISFPDGSEVIIMNAPGITKRFENRVRSRLAGRVNELKITKEEFLLLSMILICNPAILNLSSIAKNVLASQQKIYTSGLFQYCQLTYQSNGPARLADLLSLLDVTARTRNDIIHHFVLSHLCQPLTSLKRIFWDNN